MIWYKSKMVTTPLDHVTAQNKLSYLKEENSYYTLLRNSKDKCYLDSIDKKCYQGGERIKVTAPIYFETIE